MIHLFEIPITLYLQSLGAWLILPMKFFTELGSETFYLLLLPALLWCVDFTLGIRIGAMLLMSNSLNAAFKLLFLSPRPYWFDPQVKAWVSESSFGLPSGHAQNAASIWGLLAVSLKKKPWKVLMFAVIFLIGLSRIFLGVHFTSDVLLGWLIGFGLLAVFLRVEQPIRRQLKQKSFSQLVQISLLSTLAIGGLPLLVLLVVQNFQVPALWVENAQAAFSGAVVAPLNPEGVFTLAGTWLGTALGLSFLITRYGGLNTSGPLLQRALRYLLGGVGLVILWYGLKLIFPAPASWVGYSFRFIRYALVGLWTAAAAPILFFKLNLAKPVFDN